MKRASIVCVVFSILLSISNFVRADDPKPTTQPLTPDQRELKAARAQVARLQNKVEELDKQIAADKKQIEELKKQVAASAAAATPKPEKQNKLTLSKSGSDFGDDSILVGSDLSDAARVLGAKPTLYSASGEMKYYYLSNGIISGSQTVRYDLAVKDGKITRFSKDSFGVQ